MFWSPAGPTVAIGTSATSFLPAANKNLGGVARVVNITADTDTTFTIGDGDVTDSMEIPVNRGAELFIAYGPGDTHAIAGDASTLSITPGISRP